MTSHPATLTNRDRIYIAVALVLLVLALWPTDPPDKIILHDDQGNPRIAIGVTSDGTAGLYMLDHDGIPAAWIRVGDGTPALYLADYAGRLVGVGHTPIGRGLIYNDILGTEYVQHVPLPTR